MFISTLKTAIVSGKKTLDQVAEKMKEMNVQMADAGLDVNEADKYVDERIEGIRNCLRDGCLFVLMVIFT